jgi:hypothetical protein
VSSSPEQLFRAAEVTLGRGSGKKGEKLGQSVRLEGLGGDGCVHEL